MSNYKVIYEGWQRHLSEAPSYDFKPGQTAADTKADPLNKIPANLARIVKDHATSFAQQMLNDGDTGRLISFVKSVRDVGTYGKGDDQMYYVFEKPDGTLFNPMDTDVDSKDALGYYAARQSVPNPAWDPAEIDEALGDAFEKIVLMSAEKLIGQELTLSWLTNKFPNYFHSLKNDLDFLKPYDTDGDQTLSDDELNQISLDDIPALKNLPDLSDFDHEPNPYPVNAEPEADPDRRKLSPDEVAARKAQADASKAASDEPDDQDKKIAGINSREYPDSLINLLKPDPEKPGLIPDEQLTQLLQLLLKATEEDDIVLEALGGPDRDPRTFSPETTEKLNDLLDSFGLDPKVQKNLEKVLNKWAKLNTVKFSKGPDYGQALPPEELPPEASAPVDGDPQPARTGDDPQPEDEEGSVLDKVMDTVKQKAQDLGDKIPTLEQTEVALDAVSLLGVTGYGEVLATPATIAALVINIATRDWDDALIDIVSLLPVAGKAFRLSAKGAKAAKAVKTVNRAAKIADVVKKGKAAGNVAKNLGTVLGSKLDKKELQSVFKIQNFLSKLEEAGIFGDAPGEMLAVFTDMKMSANTAQSKKAPPKPGEFRPLYQDDDDLTESLERLQTLAGINKRIL